MSEVYLFIYICLSTSESRMPYCDKITSSGKPSRSIWLTMTAPTPTATVNQGSIVSKRQKLAVLVWFNGFGLADIHGNVFEWCLDHWHPSYQGAPADGSAWVTDGNDRYRVLRGDSWSLNPELCRPANRIRLILGHLLNNVGLMLGFGWFVFP